MNSFIDMTFLASIVLAVMSLFLNVVQQFQYKRVKNKIGVWAKDAKSMASSIVGMQKNIKVKKISSLADVSTNLETLANFANSMYTSLEEELGRTKKDIVK